MVNANEYGFLPQNDGETNAKALQNALDQGGEVRVTMPGEYSLSETVYIGDHTALVFAEGVTIVRQPSKSGVNGVVLINKGAYSAEKNRNIRIDGLTVRCNEVESTGFGRMAKKVGLRAHVAFLYVEDLVITNFTCTGLLAKDYALQISAFENIRLEHLFIEGRKDGVHLGWGKGFVIRHGKFRTYDDPIALNAFDYSVSNTHVGWIEDGLIEDCYDLADDSTTGYFCRILGGAWTDWYKGIEVQHSDTVVYKNRIYRVVMNPTDGKIYRSVTPPTHTQGVAEYDGIWWVMTQEGALYDCGCRNIHLKDIHLQKERTIAVAIDLNYDTYARGFYSGARPVPQGDITLENVSVEAKIGRLFRANYPTKTIVLKDSDVGDTEILFEGFDLDGLEYPTARLVVKNTPLKEGAVVSDGRHLVEVVVEK